MSTFILSLGGGLTLVTLAGLCAIRWRNSRSWGRLTPDRDGKDLSGKTVIVTGGNCGLGYYTVLELARRNATVIIASRDTQKAEEALTKIKETTGNTNLHFIHLDLASLESVRQFAQQVKEKFQEIYSLVLNAGVWFPMNQLKATVDGFEIHFGVNHLGHFLLTQLLLDRLNDSAGGDRPRIVIVSSSLMNMGKIDMEKKEFVFPPGRPAVNKSFCPTGYADSKLMNGLMAKELSAKFGDVDIVAVCPGWCKSNLSRNVPMAWWKKCLFAPIAFMFMRSSERGAQNILDGVLADELVSGGFYRECKIAQKETEKIENLSETSSALWNLSMDLAGLNK